LVLALLLLLPSCTKTNGLPSAPPPQETGQDLPANPSPPAVSGGLTAEGLFPVTGFGPIDRFYANVREDFERLSESMGEQAAQDVLPYQLSAGYTVEFDSDGILSVSRYVYQYTGGAHGMTDIFCETFSSADGRLLSLDDFFTAGREEYTKRLLVFIDQTIAQRPDDYWEDAPLLARALFPYDTFVITQDGVSLIFPEYNIAPFTTGIVRVDIPRSAVEDIFILPG
jgi:hypothetical protein